MLLLLQEQAISDYFFPIYSLGDKVEEEGKKESGRGVEYFGDCLLAK